jgi:predicted transcriptional regulator
MKPESTDSKALAATKLEDALTAKPPTLHPDDSVQQAGERMRSVEAGQWPVTERRKLVGVVPEPHPDVAAGRFGHDPRGIHVGESMSRDVAYCYEDQSCAEALAIMEARDVNYLPVVDRQQRIVGIIGRDELLARREGKQV